jgi:hypothetical protein
MPVEDIAPTPRLVGVVESTEKPTQALTRIYRSTVTEVPIAELTFTSRHSIVITNQLTTDLYFYGTRQPLSGDSCLTVNHCL